MNTSRTKKLEQAAGNTIPLPVNDPALPNQIERIVALFTQSKPWSANVFIALVIGLIFALTVLASVCLAFYALWKSR